MVGLVASYFSTSTFARCRKEGSYSSSVILMIDFLLTPTNRCFSHFKFTQRFQNQLLQRMQKVNQEILVIHSCTSYFLLSKYLLMYLFHKVIGFGTGAYIMFSIIIYGQLILLSRSDWKRPRVKWLDQFNHLEKQSKC